MKVKISDDAELDLVDGFWFYDKQDEGLGSEFRDSIKQDIRSLAIDGGRASRENEICQSFGCLNHIDVSSLVSYSNSSVTQSPCSHSEMSRAQKKALSTQIAIPTIAIRR